MCFILQSLETYLCLQTIDGRIIQIHCFQNRYLLFAIDDHHMVKGESYVVIEKSKSIKLI